MRSLLVRLCHSLVATTLVLLHGPPSSAQCGLEDIGSLGNGSAFPTAISHDGSVLVGNANIGGGNFVPFLWSASGGISDLSASSGILQGTVPVAVSADGSTVLLQREFPSELYVWTQAGGAIPLGDLGGGYAILPFFGDSRDCISADGSVVVGESGTLSGLAGHAFRWTAATGMVDLGTLGGATSSGFAVSADGSTVVGQSERASGQISAFRWTAALGMQDIGASLGSTLTRATRVSANGEAAALESIQFTPAGPSSSAYRWTVGQGLEVLVLLPGASGRVPIAGISTDGRSVAGTVEFSATDRSPFVWREGDVTVTFQQELPPNTGAVDLSADGKVLICERNLGTSFETYRATLPDPHAI